LALGKTYQEKIKIRAFEAQRQIFNMLCGTIALNGLNNTFCYNLAVSDGISESIKILLPDYSIVNNFGGFELIEPLLSDNHDMIKSSFEEVRTTTLDDFDEAVDFVKIDIEGMEDKALKGAKIILEKYKPICFVELFKTDVEFVINLFKSMNYWGFQKNNDLIAVPGFYNIKINGLNRLF
jgi:FkbM family methyltransferase